MALRKPRINIVEYVKKKRHSVAIEWRTIIIFTSVEMIQLPEQFCRYYLLIEYCKTSVRQVGRRSASSKIRSREVERANNFL